MHFSTSTDVAYLGTLNLLYVRLACVEPGMHTNTQFVGWKWVQFRQAKHPTFWVCRSQCKCGCGADLANYSHCGPRHFQEEQTNGTANSMTTDSHGQNGQNGESNTSEEYL